MRCGVRRRRLFFRSAGAPSLRHHPRPSPEGTRESQDWTSPPSREAPWQGRRYSLPCRQASSSVLLFLKPFARPARLRYPSVEEIQPKIVCMTKSITFESVDFNPDENSSHRCCHCRAAPGPPCERPTERVGIPAPPVPGFDSSGRILDCPARLPGVVRLLQTARRWQRASLFQWVRASADA